MIVLACATERELREMLAGLEKPVENGAVRVADCRILPCVTGVGPVAAGISAGEALARHPEATGMINAGICGSFDPERFPLGGICVARKEVWPEYGSGPLVSPEDFGGFFRSRRNIEASSSIIYIVKHAERES